MPYGGGMAFTAVHVFRFVAFQHGAITSLHFPLVTIGYDFTLSFNSGVHSSVALMYYMKRIFNFQSAVYCFERLYSAAHTLTIAACPLH